jgi:anti-sigma B factor antagonist
MSLRHGLSVDAVVDGDRVTLVLRGELDIATAPRLRAAVLRHATARREIIVDLAELEFIDSTGVRALVVAAQEARTARAKLTYVRPSDRVSRTLELCGMLGALPFEPDSA